MLNKHEKIFKDASQRLFNSHEGEIVLKYLQDSYVKRSAVGQDAYMTYYNLGQKELIQSLVNTLIDPEKLDEIEIYTNVNEDI